MILEEFRTGKSSIRIRIAGRQIDDFRQLSSGWVTGWGRWCARQTSSRLSSPHSASGAGRCTCFFASPACLRIGCGAILSRKAAGRVVMTKHCRVSLYCSLHLFMPRKLNTTLLLFSDLAGWFLSEIFRFVNCGA